MTLQDSSVIQIRGAREHNLTGFDLDLPKHRLIAVTGVSGSGKSSLVFGTIAAESQRLINETYPAFVQSFMPTLDRPHVDDLRNITPAIVVSQERLAPNPRSTVGTVTDAHALLRRLFATLAEPQLGSMNAYSFNVPSVQASGEITVGGKTETRTFNSTGGMCPKCEGLGQVTQLNLSAMLDESLSLRQGAIKVPGYNAGGWNVRMYAESGLLDPDKPIAEYSEQERADFLYREAEKRKIAGINMTYEGLVPRVEKGVLGKDPETAQPAQKAFIERAVVFAACPDCEGTRMAPEARGSKIAGYSIADVCALEIRQLPEFLDAVSAQDPAGGAGVAPLLAALRAFTTHCAELGIDYVSLARAAGSLSGGEAQRMKMVRHLGSALTDITYIFDEPTTGLHPQDVTRINKVLQQLRDKGNTVLVVEHNPATIACADLVVDMGPGAGKFGGQVLAVGTPAEIAAGDSATAQALQASSITLRRTPRAARGSLPVRGANRNNLHEVAVDIPLGILTALTGVAGSGKSSLLSEFLAQNCQDDGPFNITHLDQAPIRGNRRSSPATYTGLADPIRKAFAKENGVKPGLFSANSAGACPACAGKGEIETQLGPLATVSTVCADCSGTGFTEMVLALTLGGASIAQVMEFSVAEALDFFSARPVGDLPGVKVPAATKLLRTLVDVGLGYLSLGQPLSTLSGGERQRLKLAVHLNQLGKAAASNSVLVLDEPTTGLHRADVSVVLELCDKLVAAGHTVVMVEHNLAAIAHADYVIDMGPGPGSSGGQVVFSGSAAELAEADTPTGHALAAALAGSL